MPYGLAEFEERFLPEPMSGCWLWIGSIHSQGYGTFRTHDYAHRWAYEHFVGPIPAGLEIDHVCRNRRCVNPAHLEPVTRLENQLRSPISRAAANYGKSECIRGHSEWKPGRPSRPTQRYCQACNRLYQRIRKDARVKRSGETA